MSQKYNMKENKSPENDIWRTKTKETWISQVSSKNILILNIWLMGFKS